MRYLLDTDICFFVFFLWLLLVLAQILAHEDEGIALSCISAAELYFGVRKSGSARNLRALEHFLSPLDVLDFDHEAARQYGQLRAALEKKGSVIGPHDMQIAAHALAQGMTLVTNNEREFKRVPALRIENWAR